MGKWPPGQSAAVPVPARCTAGGRPGAGRRTAGVRPAWGQPDAGFWNADFCKLDFWKHHFLFKKKVKFENYVFFMRMDLSEVFSGNFMFLQNAFFMKNHVTNQFCVIFCQNLCFWKTCIFMHKNMMLKFVFKKVQLYFFQHWAVAEKIKLRHDEFWKQAPVCLC